MAWGVKTILSSLKYERTKRNGLEENKHIYQLIQLELTNQLSSEQNEELKQWINNSSENLDEYKRIRKSLLLSDRLYAMKQVDTSTDLQKVKAQFRQNSKIKQFFIQYQKVAAIMLLPFLLFSLWTVYSNFSSEDTVVQTKVMETNRGICSQITLADGTKVWLNSGSKLYYPEEFIGKIRQVKLEGEAYFEVESDKNHPFYVDLGNIKVKATGTKFNITNYPSGDRAYIYLDYGKVQLVSGNIRQEAEHVEMKKGELVSYSRNKNQYRVDNTGDKRYMAWKEGKLIFRNDNIKDVATRLGYWFNANIEVTDESLEDYIFTATFKYESLEEALKLLSYSSPISYKIIPSQTTGQEEMGMKKVIIEKRKGM